MCAEHLEPLENMPLVPSPEINCDQDRRKLFFNVLFNFKYDLLNDMEAYLMLRQLNDMEAPT